MVSEVGFFQAVAGVPPAISRLGEIEVLDLGKTVADLHAARDEIGKELHPGTADLKTVN